MSWELAHSVTLAAAVIGSIPGFLAYGKTRGRLIISAQCVHNYEDTIDNLKRYRPYTPLDPTHEGVCDAIICNITITNRFSIPMFLHEVYINDSQENQLHAKTKSLTQYGTILEAIKPNEPIRIEPNDTKILQVHMRHDDTFTTPKKVFAIDGVKKTWSSKVSH